MTTLEGVERHVIAASLDKQTSVKVSMDWMETPEAKSLLKAIKLLHKRGDPLSIASAELQLQTLDEHVSATTIKQVFNLFISRNGSFDNTTKDYIAILMSRKNKKNLLQRIDEAKTLAENDQFNDAIVLLKSLKFADAGETQKAMFWIIDSMMSTNGFRSGYEDIDLSGGLLRKNMMTIAGDSGSQKTMFAQALTIRVLQENPTYKAVFFEKEMPLEDLGRRITSFILREDSNDLMRVVSQARSIEERNDKLLEIKARVDAKLSENGELKDIMNRLELVSRDEFEDATDIWQILARRRPDIWVVDYFTMLEPKNGGIDDENMRKQAITLKNAMLDTDSFGIILSQLKQSNNVDQRANKVPMIGDMEWGKHLRQYSTWIFSIFYPSHYGLMKDKDYFFLVSRKTRHGKPIIVPLHSDPATATFREPGKKDRVELMKYINSYMEKGTNHDTFARR